MSRENVELVQSWFKRWNGGDRDFSTDELHPDFQVAKPPPGRAVCGARGTASMDAGG